MRRRQRAFSLVEMMIVVGLLGLLLAIVLPTFGKASAIGRRAACQANLTHISQAYSMRRAAEASGERSSFKADHWAADLTPYVGYHPRAFYCVEDEVPFDGAAEVKFLVSDARYTPPTPKYVLLMTTFYPYWMEYDAVDVPGGAPYVWRLNDADYQTLKGTMHEGTNLVDHLHIYTPGEDPRTYWYVFEDQINPDNTAGDDSDFEDLNVRVVRSRTGSITITVVTGQTINSFDLIGPGDKVIAKNIGMGGGSGPWEFPGASNISYGMNWRAEHIAKGQHKILLLDYEAEVCNVGAGAPLVGSGWDVDRAPRHLGKANVLFAGGHVLPIDVDTIDPDIDSLDGKYWDPVR